jgi:hypothetical protein
MKCFPDFNASRSEQVYYTFSTPAELSSLGYIPTMNANDIEVIWRYVKKSFTA